ncbi:MAG: recombination DNA repair RAD52 pathway protein [Phenylobacterium sp.]|jgi:recombination DNA repair RAD52 pathway protein
MPCSEAKSKHTEQLRLPYTSIKVAFMFVSIEKATALTGKSKNALYRLMSKGHINFVRCTKGKRYLEVTELKRVYGELTSEVTEETIAADALGSSSNTSANTSSSSSSNHSANDGELLTIIASLQNQLISLHQKVDHQGELLEALSGGGVVVQQALPEQVAAPSQPARPEQDPEWPPFITCYADLAKRDEIKARYSR